MSFIIITNEDPINSHYVHVFLTLTEFLSMDVEYIIVKQDSLIKTP